MELLCRPVADWELRTRIDSVAKSGKEPEPHVDVCTGCKVDGGCNDVDIHCGLVAIHNRQADGTVATSLKKRLLQNVCHPESHLSQRLGW